VQIWKHARADEVLALALRVAPAGVAASVGEERRHKLAKERPLSESYLERKGLKEGTPAGLPDLQGGRRVRTAGPFDLCTSSSFVTCPVSTASYKDVRRGDETLLLGVYISRHSGTTP